MRGLFLSVEGCLLLHLASLAISIKVREIAVIIKSLKKVFGFMVLVSLKISR